VEHPSRQIHRGLLWIGSAAATTRVVDLGSTIVILFFLTKEELGGATVAWTIGMILEATNRVGLDIAIVQSKEIKRIQLNSAIWFSLGLSVLLGGTAYALAPWLGVLFKEPELQAFLLPTIAKLFFLTMAMVPMQLLNRQLRYPLIAGVQTSATFFAALVRIGLAVAGAGAWALLIAHAMHGAFTWIAARLVQPFSPRLEFSWRQLRPLLRFGSFVGGNDLIYQLFRNVDFLLLSAFSGTGAVGVYRVAFDVAMSPAMVLSDVINRTGLPVLSALADKRRAFGESFSWMTRTLGLVSLPVVAGLAIVVPDLIILIQSGEYAAAVLPAQILCAAALMRVAYQTFPPMFQAAGHPELALRYGMLVLVTLTLFLSIGITLAPPSYRIVALCGAWTATYPVLLVAIGRTASKFTGVSPVEWLGSFTDGIKGVILATVAAGLSSWALAGWSPLARLAIIIPIFVGCYWIYLRLGLGITLRGILTAGKPTVELSREMIL